MCFLNFNNFQKHDQLKFFMYRCYSTEARLSQLRVAWNLAEWQFKRYKTLIRDFGTRFSSSHHL